MQSSSSNRERKMRTTTSCMPTSSGKSVNGRTASEKAIDSRDAKKPVANEKTIDAKKKPVATLKSVWGEQPRRKRTLLSDRTANQSLLVNGEHNSPEERRRKVSRRSPEKSARQVQVLGGMEKKVKIPEKAKSEASQEKLAKQAAKTSEGTVGGVEKVKISSQVQSNISPEQNETTTNEDSRSRNHRPPTDEDVTSPAPPNQKLKSSKNISKKRASFFLHPSSMAPELPECSNSDNSSREVDIVQASADIGHIESNLNENPKECDADHENTDAENEAMDADFVIPPLRRTDTRREYCRSALVNGGVEAQKQEKRRRVQNGGCSKAASPPTWGQKGTITSFFSPTNAKVLSETLSYTSTAGRIESTSSASEDVDATEVEVTAEICGVPGTSNVAEQPARVSGRRRVSARVGNTQAGRRGMVLEGDVDGIKKHVSPKDAGKRSQINLIHETITEATSSDETDAAAASSTDDDEFDLRDALDPRTSDEFASALLFADDDKAQRSSSEDFQPADASLFGCPVLPTVKEEVEAVLVDLVKAVVFGCNAHTPSPLHSSVTMRNRFCGSPIALQSFDFEGAEVVTAGEAEAEFNAKLNGGKRGRRRKRPPKLTMARGKRTAPAQRRVVLLPAPKYEVVHETPLPEGLKSILRAAPDTDELLAVTPTQSEAEQQVQQEEPAEEEEHPSTAKEATRVRWRSLLDEVRPITPLDGYEEGKRRMPDDSPTKEDVEAVEPIPLSAPPSAAAGRRSKRKLNYSEEVEEGKTKVAKAGEAQKRGRKAKEAAKEIINKKTADSGAVASASDDADGTVDAPSTSAQLRRSARARAPRQTATVIDLEEEIAEIEPVARKKPRRSSTLIGYGITSAKETAERARQEKLEVTRQAKQEAAEKARQAALEAKRVKARRSIGTVKAEKPTPEGNVAAWDKVDRVTREGWRCPALPLPAVRSCVEDVVEMSGGVGLEKKLCQEQVVAFVSTEVQWKQLNYCETEKIEANTIRITSAADKLEASDETLSASTRRKAQEFGNILLEDPSRSWLELSAPSSQSSASQSTAAVLGSQSTQEELRKWLSDWKARLQKQRSVRLATHRKKRNGEFDDFLASDSDFEESCDVPLRRLAVLHGPAGCGKSARVVGLANELGFKVLELPSSVQRSQKTMMTALDAAWSHFVGTAGVAKKSAANFFEKKGAKAETKAEEATFSVILLDEMDVILDESEAFYSALQQFCAKSLVPVMATCNTYTALAKLNPELYSLFEVNAVEEHQASTQLSALALSSNCVLSKAEAVRLYQACSCDLRRAIQCLDYHIRTKTGQEAIVDLNALLSDNTHFHKQLHLHDRNPQADSADLELTSRRAALRACADVLAAPSFHALHDLTVGVLPSLRTTRADEEETMRDCWRQEMAGWIAQRLPGFDCPQTSPSPHHSLIPDVADNLLPLTRLASSRAFALDYMPVLCRMAAMEGLNAVAGVKRRFTHHFKHWPLEDYEALRDMNRSCGLQCAETADESGTAQAIAGASRKCEDDLFTTQ